MTQKTPAAALLIIGNEILSGRTQDANLNYIAKKLLSIGVKLAEARVVPDVEVEIVSAVNTLRARYDYVFTTGGIGGTHDDITADCIAKAFSVPVIEHPDARAILEARYKPADLNQARLNMARMPQGSKLVANPVSGAPGFSIENVYVMAGVPSIMQAMLDNIVATLKHGPAVFSIAIAASLPENKIAEELGALAKRYDHLDIGSYPWFRSERWGTSLVVRGTDEKAVKAAADEIFAMVAKHGGMPEIEVTLPSVA